MNWMAIGPAENWKVTLEGSKVWGVPPRYEKLWTQVALGDTILFYATAPVKGVIGYGTVRSKLRDDKPLWREEAKLGHALWPLRFTLEVNFALPPESWETKRVRVLPRQAVLQKGFQRLTEEVARDLTDALHGSR